MLSRPLNSF